MKALMTLVLVLLLAGCAAGQGGADRTTQEETTANGTEETTVQKRTGDRNRPPDSTLSYGGQEVRGTLGSYCTATTCFDVAAMPVSPKQGTLTVPTGSEMVFRYEGHRPLDTVEVGYYPLSKNGGPWDGSLKAQGSGVERTIPAELPPGDYGVDVWVRWSQSDVTYTFHVMVE